MGNCIQVVDDINKKNEDGETELIRGSIAGDISKCRDLIKRGAHLNITDEIGSDALIHASSRGHYNVASLLCDSGADVTIHNEHGFNALIIASDNGHTNIVSLLISAGARINEESKYGETALSWAASNDEYEICQILITKYGADCTHERVRRYLDKLLVWAVEQDDTKMIGAVKPALKLRENYEQSMKEKMQVKRYTREEEKKKGEKGENLCD